MPKQRKPRSTASSASRRMRSGVEHAARRAAATSRSGSSGRSGCSGSWCRTTGGRRPCPARSAGAGRRHAGPPASSELARRAAVALRSAAARSVVQRRFSISVAAAHEHDLDQPGSPRRRRTRRPARRRPRPRRRSRRTSRSSSSSSPVERLVERPRARRSAAASRGRDAGVGSGHAVRADAVRGSPASAETRRMISSLVRRSIAAGAEHRGHERHRRGSSSGTCASARTIGEVSPSVGVDGRAGAGRPRGRSADARAVHGADRRRGSPAGRSRRAYDPLKSVR